MAEELIRFRPVAVVTQVWFKTGNTKRSGGKFVSLLLVPIRESGSGVITEVTLPEVFLQ